MTLLLARRAGAWVTTALAVALLAGLAAPSAAETLREETRETYPIQPGSRVEITNVNGDVELFSWDRSEALVEATKVLKYRGRRGARALDDLRIEVRHSPESLEIETRQPPGVASIFAWLFGGLVQSQVTYRVTLPRGTRVEATTVNGDVSVDAVGGTVLARTTNGRIEISGAEGAATARTTNGSIRAELVELGSGRVDLHTINGSIDVYLPATAAFEVSASTVNGSVQSDFAALPSGASALFRRTLRGAINGGGGQLTLGTVNGSIELHARDDV
jgi:hypothetical protein